MAKCGERITDRVAGAARLSGVDDQPIYRYLGLSLGGAKSDRTALTVIDYYHRQNKAFVVDIFSSISSSGEETADQVLVELVRDVAQESSSVRVMGVDAPLTLPPCLLGCDPVCKGYESCKKPAVKWMRSQYQKAKAKNARVKHFTPYSQRPVDIYFRYRYPEHNLFQDETMGANLAPQAARMSYLKNHLSEIKLVEVWPKLSLYHLHKLLKLTKREVLAYRHMEDGVHVRGRVLERLVENSSLFVYERDLKKFLADIAAFDSFLCAWVAMQSDLGRVVKFKSDVPLESGWVQVPDL